MPLDHHFSVKLVCCKGFCKFSSNKCKINPFSEQYHIQSTLRTLSWESVSWQYLCPILPHLARQLSDDKKHEGEVQLASVWQLLELFLLGVMTLHCR